MRNKETLLCIAAHPDDEVLGCGGTLGKYAKQGHDVYTVILAEGLTSRGPTEHKQLEKLKTIAQEANQNLGVKELIFMNFPDNKMDSVPRLEIIQKLETAIQKIKPSLVFTHHPSDLNIDHRLCFESVLTACRPLPGSQINAIYSFEVPSATGWMPTGDSAGQFHPNYFVGIEDTLSLKMKSLSIYNSEMRDFPHARSLKSVEALAIQRGSFVGMKAAEAFLILRQINP